MKRLDDLLIWLAIAAVSCAWLLAAFFSTGLSPHFLLLPVVPLLCAVAFGQRERSRWKARQKAYMQELTQAMGEYQTLSSQAMDFAGEQFSGLGHEMSAAQNVIRESTGKLYGSLTGLESESSGQRQMLKALIDELLAMTGSSEGGKEGQAGQAGLQRFFDETNNLIQEFVGKMREVRESSQCVASSFSSMSTQVHQITSALNDISDITKQTDLLALNAAIEAARAGEAGRGFAVVADEVRKLAAHTGTVNAEVRQILDGILRSLEETSVRVEQASNMDMSIADRSRATLDSLGQEMQGLTATAREQSRNVTEITEKIQQLTQEGVLAMQFEDVVTQMMDRIGRKTENAGEFLQGFLDLYNDQRESDGLRRFRTRSQKLQELLAESHARQNAVGSVNKNQSHAADAVELF
nr:methyl-accepting chemotaxis protein [Azonexus sp.]